MRLVDTTIRICDNDIPFSGKYIPLSCYCECSV